MSSSPSQKSDLTTSSTPGPVPLVFKRSLTKELKVDAGDGHAIFKYTPQQVLQTVREGARLY